MLSGQKGKIVITTQSPPQPKQNKKKTPDKPVKPNMPKTTETLRPILLLSLLIGYLDRRFRVRGIFGGLLWLVSLTLHSAFDFLSRKTYGYAWASIQMLLFLCLAVCTYSAKKKTVPWLERGLCKLESEDKYLKTFARIRKLYRVLPYAVIAFAVFTTGLEYFCYAYDKAFSLTFDQTIPTKWDTVLKIVWVITNMHVLYGFALFWCVAMCNMYSAGYSMIEYHEMMASHLKNRETPVTFRQAVHSFAERGRFLKKSASACRLSLTFLLIYSIASLGVNAFYYLYKSRKAGYIYFALMPPICSVYPLCLAAWVTKQYKWYLAVVVKAWAERPESSDEEEESESDHHRKGFKEKGKALARKVTRRARSTRNKKADEAEDKTFRRKSPFPLRQTRSNPLTTVSYSDTDSRVEEIPLRGSFEPLGNGLSPLQSVSFTSVSDTELSEEEKKPKSEWRRKSANELRQVSTSNPNLKLRKETDKLFPLEVSRSASISDMDGLTDEEEKEKPEVKSEEEAKPKVDRKRVMQLVLRGAARAVGRLQYRSKLPKFNFEKYITYLQNVMPNVGFDIMGITVTWNMVSTLLFLEVSLLALFVQESIFGNQKANVSL